MPTNKKVIAFITEVKCFMYEETLCKRKILNCITVTSMVKIIQEEICHSEEYIPCNFGHFQTFYFYQNVLRNLLIFKYISYTINFELFIFKYISYKIIFGCSQDKKILPVSLIIQVVLAFLHLDIRYVYINSKNYVYRKKQKRPIIWNEGSSW